MRNHYKYIPLSNGDYIQIKFDEMGIVYDRFNKDDEHQESYGWDWYEVPILLQSHFTNLKMCKPIEEHEIFERKNQTKK